MGSAAGGASRAERLVRIVFGVVVVLFFASLAFGLVVMRAASGDSRPKNAPSDALLVAVTLFLALIATYGLDQLLTGIWPSRSRWFSRAERVLGESLGTHDRGTVTVAHVWGAPIRVHWSVLVGLVLVGRFNLGACVGFLAVIIAHELGHAVLVRRFGQHVVALSLHALGGECHWVGRPTPAQRTLIAWGGVAGQAFLAGAAWALVRVLPQTFTGHFGEALGFTLLKSNLVMAAFNLLPFHPLDGFEAWAAPIFQWARGTYRAQPADPIDSLVKSALDRAKRSGE
jgi:Zn-dependent protease